MVIGVLRGARACRRSSNGLGDHDLPAERGDGQVDPGRGGQGLGPGPGDADDRAGRDPAGAGHDRRDPRGVGLDGGDLDPRQERGAQAPGRRGVALDHTVGRADAVPGVERRRQEVVGAQHRGQAGRLGRGQQAGGHAHRVLQGHRGFEGGQVLGRGQAEQVPDLVQVDGPARPLGEALEGLQAPGPEGDVDGVGELGPDPARRLRRGARPQRVPFEEEDVGHPRFGQVEGDRRAHDPATDDDHLGRSRQGRPAHVKVTPWASGSSSE